MVDAHRLAAFAVAAFLIIIIPGPSVLFVVSRGVTLGRRAALATVLGNTLGAFVQGVLVALGLGTLVSRSLAVYKKHFNILRISIIKLRVLLHYCRVVNI